MVGSRNSPGGRRGLGRAALITGAAVVAAGALWSFRGPALPWATAQSAPPAAPAPVTAAPQAAQAAPAPVGLDYVSRVVAYVYENEPVTRQELGEYLIARYGVEKLPLLLNKKVIDLAARSRGIEVTAAEVDLSLGEELKNLRVDLSTFVKTVLPRYKKSLQEWKEDVLRPRLLMTRFCQKQVTVTEQEIQLAFEANYGEKIQGRLIQWAKEDEAKAKGEYARIRDSEDAFADAARGQATSQLAATGGKLHAFGRHTLGDQNLDNTIFKLAPGRMSELIMTPQGWVVFKCDARIPPDRTISPEAVREKLVKEIADRKIGGDIADAFKQILKDARPDPCLKAERLAPGAPLPDPKQVVGRVNGNVEVTREELGEFLIARHGADRLELLVNHRVIDRACRAKGVVVTDEEVDKGLQDDLKAMNLDEAHFVKDMLSKWGKTIYEWREDVVRPKLQLSRLARARVSVSEEDIKKGYEAYHGEKREVRMILYPANQERFAVAQYQTIQNSEEEFARACREQPTPSLAAKHGRLDGPIGHNALDSEDLEREIFALQPGQLSPLVGTPQGKVVVKLDKIIPPDGAPLDQATRDAISREVTERKVQIETQKVFQELRVQANPRLLMRDAAQPVDLAAESARLVKDLHQGMSGPAGPGSQAGQQGTVIPASH